LISKRLITRKLPVFVRADYFRFAEHRLERKKSVQIVIRAST
jgi:hypothetical protein